MLIFLLMFNLLVAHSSHGKDLGSKYLLMPHGFFHVSLYSCGVYTLIIYTASVAYRWYYPIYCFGLFYFLVHSIFFSVLFHCGTDGFAVCALAGIVGFHLFFQWRIVDFWLLWYTLLGYCLLLYLQHKLLMLQFCCFAAFLLGLCLYVIFCCPCNILSSNMHRCSLVRTFLVISLMWSSTGFVCCDVVFYFSA